MTGSAGQKRIQTPFFEKLGVYLPPLELQKRFADFVHLVDKSRFVVHSRYFLWLNFTFVSSTIAYSRVVSILECPKRC
ncbi:MAG: restriction endonuclease subunit S [Mollicutes bacterium]|nr:restriction endonuclease subunit S [Mollicutes bacterium]